MTRCEGKTFQTVAHVFLKILFDFVLKFYFLYLSLIHVASFGYVYCIKIHLQVWLILTEKVTPEGEVAVSQQM